MSPSTFWYPATCAATNGDALATRCCKVKTLIRCPAATDFLPPLFVSMTLPLCYRWRRQLVYSGGFWCELFLPTRDTPAAFLPFLDHLNPSPPLFLKALSAWPVIPLAISSVKLLVPVHLFLVAKRLQHPLQMHLPSSEIWGLPWLIPLLSLVHVQLPSAALSSLGMPALLLGNISTELFAVSPAGFC